MGRGVGREAGGTVGLALAVVSVLVLGEAWVIYQLLNRVLELARVSKLELPKFKQPEGIPEFEPVRRRPKFTVPIES